MHAPGGLQRPPGGGLAGCTGGGCRGSAARAARVRLHHMVPLGAGLVRGAWRARSLSAHADELLGYDVRCSHHVRVSPASCK